MVVFWYNHIEDKSFHVQWVFLEIWESGRRSRAFARKRRRPEASESFAACLQKCSLSRDLRRVDKVVENAGQQNGRKCKIVTKKAGEAMLKK